MNMGEERRPTPPQQHGHGHRGPGAPSSSSGPGPTPSTSASAGGGVSHGHPQPQPPRSKPPSACMPASDYKLLFDPTFHKGHTDKMYRVNGIVAGQASYNYHGPPKEPRTRRPHHQYDRYFSEPMELPVPRFVIDANFVGVPPPLQVTITNINDNIDKNFLSDLLLKHGAYEEMEIFFHPVTKKHLGIAHALFFSKRGAALAIDKLNSTSVMGQVLNVFLDPFKKKCTELVEEATAPPDKTKAKKTGESQSKKLHESAGGVEGKGTSSSKHSKEKAAAVAVEEEPSLPSHGLHKSSSFESYPPPAASGYPQAHPQAMIPAAVPTPMSMSVAPHASSAYYQPHHQALGSSPPPPPAAVPSPFSNGNINEFDGVGVGAGAEVGGSGATTVGAGIGVGVGVDGGGSPSQQQQIDLDTRIKMMLSSGSNQFGALLGACLSGDEGADGSGAGSGSAADVRRSRLSLDKNDIWKASGSDGEDDDPVELSHARKFKRNTFVPVDDEDSRPPSPFLASRGFPLQNGVGAGSGLIRLDGLDEVSDEDSDENDNMYSSKKAHRQRKGQDKDFYGELSMAMAPCPEVPLPPDYEYGGGALPEMTPEMQAFYQQHYPQTPDMCSQTPYDPFGGSTPGSWDGLDPYAAAAYYGGAYGMPLPPLPAEEDPADFDKPDLPELTPTEVVEAVQARILAELKSIVRRDLHKKLIEQCAFKVVEDWAANKDRNHRESQANDRLAKLQQAGHAGGGMGVGGDAGGKDSDIFGLGFRATIPRMPSFRRQRSPSPRRGHGRRHGRDGSSDTSVGDEDGDRERDRWQDEDEDSRSSLGGRRERGRDSRRRHGRGRGHSLSSSGSRSVSSSRSSGSEEDKSDEEGASRSSSSLSSRSRSGSTASASSGLDEKLVRKPGGARAVASSDEEESLSGSEDAGAAPSSPSMKKSKLKELSPPPTAPSKKSKAKRLSSPSPSPERESERVPTTKTKTPGESEESMDVDVEGPKKTFEPASVEVTALDHCYATTAPEPEPLPVPPSKGRGQKAPKGSAIAAMGPPDMKPEKLFLDRREEEMQKNIVDFLMEGIDAEDYQYSKQMYEMSTGSSGGGAGGGLDVAAGMAKELQPLLSKVRWVEHPATKVDHKQKVDAWNRPNRTGSCRTEGFFRYTPEEKMAQKQQLIAKLGWEMRNKPASSISHSLHLQSGSKNQLIREARSHQRRLLTEFGDNESDLLRFNQLKFRKKDLRFARSYIHDWGLFAAEPIAADEMVIEYVGQVVRAGVSDCREKAYEKVGIMSSYLFRLDGDEGLVVDATKCGNLSRFINHSCNPNCIAKTITVEGEKKIVIYSKQEIAVDEEITYDYKFPLEETKIKCLCGAYNCRGYLN